MASDPTVIQHQIDEKKAELVQLVARKKDAIEKQRKEEERIRPLLQPLLRTWRYYFRNHDRLQARSFARAWLRGPGTMHELRVIGWTPEQFEEWAIAQMVRKKMTKKVK